jgi:hypothetical protein
MDATPITTPQTTHRVWNRKRYWFPVFVQQVRTTVEFRPETLFAKQKKTIKSSFAGRQTFKTGLKRREYRNAC